MGLSCDLVFPLPPQTDDISGNKRSRLEIFRETLENLPFGDLERAAQELFNVLYKTNRMVLSQDERLSLLQLLEEPSFHVLAGLQEKIKTLVSTEKLPYYDELKKSLPEGLLGLLNISGSAVLKIKVILSSLTPLFKRHCLNP